MSPPRTFRTTTPLADKMRRPGGRRVSSALAAAGAALATHRVEAMAQARKTLAQLESMTLCRDEDHARLVYERAAALVDLIGFFQTGPLFDVAYSLCEVSDRMRTSGVWHWPAVEVHLQALALILSDDCRRTTASDELLAGLRAVADRIPNLPRALS